MPEGRGAQAGACPLSLMGWWLSIARLSCGRLLFLLLLVFSGMATPVAAQQGTVSNGCSLHQNADGCAEGQDMRFRVYTTSGQPVSQDVVVEYIIRHTAQMTRSDYAFVTNGGTFEEELDGDTDIMHFKVRLPSGQSEAFYRIRVQDDNLDEPRESFRVEQQRIVSGPGTIIRSVSFSDRWLHDTDPTPVILSGPQGDIVEDGGTKTFTVTLGRALVSGEALQVPLVFSGRAGRATDYRLSCAPAMGVTCDFSKGFIAFGSQPGAVRTATITLTAIQDTEDEGTGEDISIRLGTLNANSGKATGLHGGATGSGELRFDILDDDDTVLDPSLPVISITGGTAVTEGSPAEFTVTATPAPAADITVKLIVSDDTASDFVAAGDEGDKTVIIGTGGTVSYSVNTVDDSVYEADGTVAVTVVPNANVYTVSSTAHKVAVTDNDIAPPGTPVASFVRASSNAGEDAGTHHVAVTLSRAPASAITLGYTVGGTATAGTDYTALSGRVQVAAGTTRVTIPVVMAEDSIVEGGETVVLTLTAGTGYSIGNSNIIHTLAITDNDIASDPDIPAQARHAGLVRFGRTVGEQSVSAVRDRLSADRRQGFTGSLAGQALPEVICDYDKAAPKHIPEDDAWRRNCPGAEISEDAELAGSGAGSGGPTAVTALRSWLAGPGDAVDAGAGAQVRALDATDIVAGTSFALTRETDGGGTLALWGRGVHSGFSGQQGGIDIDGRVTGFQLGADHARGDWTYGLMVSRSTGDIEYSAAQGGGEIGLDLTALVPYVGWDVTAGLSAWGTLGFGRGDMTLTPETPETPDGGAVLRSDVDWQMAAAGVEGILTPSTRVLGGAALNWHADALWTRTRADALPGRRGAPGGETTRLRFGLESRWQHSLASGGVLTPQLEMALRHDGGDAETGFGLEIGGGLDWSAPERGLSLGLSGRTLALHEDGSFGDWGVSVVLDYDPAPDTKRGFAARLSHDLGGSASGGAQALLGPESFPGLNAASGGGRWALETAYGVSRGRGRVGSSYMALSGADAVAATRLGYRLEPDAPHAEDVSVDVWAEPALQPPTNPRNTNNHRLGMDLNWKW